MPAFFLARRVVRDGLALLAALMSVAIPSMAYTGTVMTENAFYPLFLLVALVLVVVLERPTLLFVALLLLLVGLAYATRVQAVALAPAILLAPFVLARVRAVERHGHAREVPVAVRDRRRRRRRRSRRPGSCRADSSAPTSPSAIARTTLGEALRYLWWHVAELSLYVLVIPLAATIVLVARARSLDARLQAFLAATVSLTVCVVPS